MAVAGVDACRAGWFVVVLDASGTTEGLVVERLEQLSERRPDLEAFGVDIPIGLPTEGRRAADVAAREFVGPRRNSVFFTPVRAALTAPTHREASDLSKERTGHGVSQQAYALVPKILEAEVWVHERSAPVWEVHPEVSFTVMLGAPPSSSKTTWAGMRERLGALEREGIALEGIGDAGANARVDDVLDAAAAAWSARRLARSEGISLPDPPEADPATGRPIAIWT